MNCAPLIPTLKGRSLWVGGQPDLHSTFQDGSISKTKHCVREVWLWTVPCRLRFEHLVPRWQCCLISLRSRASLRSGSLGQTWGFLALPDSCSLSASWVHIQCDQPASGSCFPTCCHHGEEHHDVLNFKGIIKQKWAPVPLTCFYQVRVFYHSNRKITKTALKNLKI